MQGFVISFILLQAVQLFVPGYLSLEQPDIVQNISLQKEDCEILTIHIPNDLRILLSDINPPPAGFINIEIRDMLSPHPSLLHILDHRITLHGCLCTVIRISDDKLLEEYLNQTRLSIFKSRAVHVIVEGSSSLQNILGMHVKGIDMYIYNAQWRLIYYQNAEEKLKQQIIQVATIHQPPYVIVGENGEITGSDYELTMAFARANNIQMNLTKMVTYFDIYDGMSNKQYDMALAQLVISKKMKSYIDFSSYIYNLDICYLSPLPKEVSSFWTVFLPFQLTIWICLSLTLVFLIATLFLVIIRHNVVEVHQVFISSSMTIIRPLFHQHIPLKDLKHVAKVLLSVWLAMSYILTLSYKSNLLSLLVSKRYEQPVDSSEDVVNSDYTLFLLKNAYLTQANFQLSQNPLRQYLYQERTLKRNGEFNTTDNELILDQVSKGHGVMVNARRNMLTHRHKVHFSSESISSDYTFFGFSKGHWLEPLISKFFSRMQSMGIYQRMFYDHITANGTLTAPHEKQSKINYQTVLGVKQTFMIFFIYVALQIVAVGTLLIEIYS